MEVPGGFKLSFSEVRTSASIQAPSIGMAANIMGSSAVNLPDSGGDQLLEALQPLVGRDIAVLNLGDGYEWHLYLRPRGPTHLLRQAGG